ncbi:hypothetical protein HOY82DRAFT_562101, partial [Tuber indicum]
MLFYKRYFSVPHHGLLSFAQVFTVLALARMVLSASAREGAVFRGLMPLISTSTLWLEDGRMGGWMI